MMIKFIFTFIFRYVLRRYVNYILGRFHIFLMIDIHIKRFHLIIMIKW